MNTGQVKFYNALKGFGFIKETDSDEEIFVHKSGLIDNIKENDRVEFRVEKSEKGLSARDVRVVQ